MKGLGLAILFGSLGASIFVALSLLVAHLNPKPFVLGMAALIWAFLTALTYLVGVFCIRTARLPSYAGFGVGGLVPIALLVGVSLINSKGNAVPLMSTATVVALVLLWLYLVACSMLAFRWAPDRPPGRVHQVK